jgi:hypothetical protein
MSIRHAVDAPGRRRLVDIMDRQSVGSVTVGVVVLLSPFSAIHHDV